MGRSKTGKTPDSGTITQTGGSRGVRKTRALVVGLSSRDRPTKDLDLSLALVVSLDRGYPVLKASYTSRLVA